MFCLNYYKYNSYINEADELKIYYRPADTTLPAFVEKYQDKTIIIDVANYFEDTDVKLLKALSDKYQNIKIIIDFYNKEDIKKAQDAKIPFFFSNYVSTIDEMYGLLKFSPTDMYICEELGFFLNKISPILHEHNIKVRVFPNICQSSFLAGIDSIKTFFIRPEDIPVYSTYVDVFELISDERTQETIFKAYKQNKWFGEVSEIIPSFHGKLDSKYIVDGFGLIRSQCGKRCLYKPGSCSICDRFIEIGNTLKENKITIMHKKKPN